MMRYLYDCICMPFCETWEIRDTFCKFSANRPNILIVTMTSKWQNFHWNCQNCKNYSSFSTQTGESERRSCEGVKVKKHSIGESFSWEFIFVVSDSHANSPGAKNRVIFLSRISQAQTTEPEVKSKRPVSTESASHWYTVVVEVDS